jgi:carbonic anhydrase
MIRERPRFFASRRCSAARFSRRIILDGSETASHHRRPSSVIVAAAAHRALRSITVAQHLFGIQNIVVVHHSHCGATSFTADGIIDAYEHEHRRDISKLYPRSSICITDYEASLKHDTALIRAHAGTPGHVNIFGYFYDIDTRMPDRGGQDIRKDRSPH